MIVNGMFLVLIDLNVFDVVDVECEVDVFVVWVKVLLWVGDVLV